MAIARVQTKAGQTSVTSASLAVTLDTPPTPGNLLIAAANSDATVATPSGFTLAVSAIAGQALYLWYRVVQSGDSATVTFVPSVSDCVAAGLLEYSGLTASPFDKVASNTTLFSASAISTGTTPATSQVNELVVAAAGPHSVGAPWTLSSWTAGFTSQITQGNAVGLDFAGLFVADRIEPAVSTESATCTFTGNFSNAGAAIVTFKGVNLPAQQDLDWQVGVPLQKWKAGYPSRKWLVGTPRR